MPQQSAGASLSLVPAIRTRDGSLLKDSKRVNMVGDQKRAGTVQIGTYANAGQAQGIVAPGLVMTNNQITNVSSGATFPASPSSATVTTSVPAGTPFTFPTTELGLAYFPDGSGFICCQNAYKISEVFLFNATTGAISASPAGPITTSLYGSKLFLPQVSSGATSYIAAITTSASSGQYYTTALSTVLTNTVTGAISPSSLTSVTIPSGLGYYYYCIVTTSGLIVAGCSSGFAFYQAPTSGGAPSLIASTTAYACYAYIEQAVITNNQAWAIFPGNSSNILVINLSTYAITSYAAGGSVTKISLLSDGTVVFTIAANTVSYAQFNISTGVLGSITTVALSGVTSTTSYFDYSNMRYLIVVAGSSSIYAMPTGSISSLTLMATNTVSEYNNSFFNPVNSIIYASLAGIAGASGAGTDTVMDALAVTGMIPGLASIPSNQLISGTPCAYPNTVLLKTPTQLWSYSNGTLTQITNGYPTTTTVPGLVQLDQTTYVMDTSGFIWGSNTGDASTWTALNFIIANEDASSPIALALLRNIIVAFKSASISFFYDAGNPPPGSALSAYVSAYSKIGCLHANTIQNWGDGIFFVGSGVTGCSGPDRQVYFLQNFQFTPVSSPEINRVLQTSALIPTAQVYSGIVESHGQSIYVLTLMDIAVTLAYDTASKDWTQWSSLTALTSSAVSLTVSGNVVTVTYSGAVVNDGDPVTISGSTVSSANGLFQASYISSTSFSYQIDVTASGSSSATMVAYTEGVFNCAATLSYGGTTQIQGISDGKLYQMSDTQYEDAGAIPIDMQVITEPLRTTSTGQRVRIGAAMIDCDLIQDSLMLRYTNDDFQTYSSYSEVELSNIRARVLKQGSAQRRSYQLRYIGNQLIRVRSLLLDVHERLI